MSDLLLSVLFLLTVQNEIINIIMMIYNKIQTHQIDASTDNMTFSSLYIYLTIYYKCLNHSGKQEEDRG